MASALTHSFPPPTIKFLYFTIHLRTKRNNLSSLDFWKEPRLWSWVQVGSRLWSLCPSRDIAWILILRFTSCMNLDLEWKIIYVGSAESEEYDQVLDSVLVGPVPAGRHMFVFQADAPNPGLIPDADAVGVTVVLITCTYRGQEFIRVGYYVNNEYTETELRENPPVKPDFSKLQRNILASNPRVTRFHINWEDNTEKLEDAESSNPNLQSLLSTDALPSASKGWSTSENSLNVMLESHMDCM
ncbi:histone chaperone ASF1A isoform X1 [Orcinus orca]|uniref:Histone chaperone ASF1A isoform X1 n=2 Tax=Boreoeutheria TaxID=1437010 RepID=A0A2U4AW68_TURTR|nr:histone chaperone ASF1A isoform X1 [Tursiops truncatus]XP_030709452.1 histone chaperone ASF1A isoform X1 [Globicephala melas]XP_033274485.1 histone chaperone ASF1A isoform X1 [Orcinus orca]